MDSSAIQIIQQTAIEAEKKNRLDTCIPAVILRDEDGEQRVESIESLQAHRSLFRGTFRTNWLQEFARYVADRVGGDGFIDAAALSATVIFDLYVNADGTPIDKKSLPCFPGHCGHYAVLQLKHTPAYDALNRAVGNPMTQRGLVEWLEDWSDHLAADYAEGSEANANDPTRMRQAITALRKVKVKASAEAVHTNKDFGASRSALEDIEASSDVGLPRGFRFTCHPCEDLAEQVFYLRLGVTPDPEKPRFFLRWPRKDTDLETIGRDFQAKLRNAIGDQATLLLGSFDPGK